MVKASTSVKSLRRRSLHEEIADHIRELIIQGTLAEGERVDEVGLCEQLDISRTPMREALKVLHSEGFVRIEPNRGSWVSILTEKELKELFEVISGLERMAAELTASRISDSNVARLEQMQESMEDYYRKGDRAAYFSINQETHRAIITLSGNDTLSALHSKLLTRASRGRYMAIGSATRWESAIEEHRQLLEALRQRDSTEAGRIMFEHTRHTGTVALEAMKTQQPALSSF